MEPEQQEASKQVPRWQKIIIIIAAVVAFLGIAIVAFGRIFPFM